MHQFRSGTHGHRSASHQLAVRLDAVALAILELHSTIAAGRHDRREGGDSSTAHSRGRRGFQELRLLVQTLHGSTRLQKVLNSPRLRDQMSGIFPRTSVDIELREPETEAPKTV
jgi:hypothetical protein